MTWLYNGMPLTDDDIPAKAAGFIYLITSLDDGRRYLGRKLLTRAHQRQKNKKIIRTRVESDWRDYWSSSPDLLAEIAERGTDHLKREIIMFADTKGQLNYLEERFLYGVGAIESDLWMNSNIRAKQFKRNILGKVNTNEIDSLISSLKDFS